MTYRYHHLHLISTDLERMIGFFTDTLGGKLVVRRKFGTADGATLDLNGIRINLRVAREDESISDDSLRARYGYDHLGLEVEDVGAAYTQLSNKGFDFISPPKEVGDVKFAFFKGPDNITIELVQQLR
jgi:catechol 2,3-dioxygenase-like lactoylglutathione lyase family enzyme